MEPLASESRDVPAHEFGLAFFMLFDVLSMTETMPLYHDNLPHSITHDHYYNIYKKNILLSLFQIIPSLYVSQKNVGLYKNRKKVILCDIILYLYTRILFN